MVYSIVNQLAQKDVIHLLKTVLNVNRLLFTYNERKNNTPQASLIIMLRDSRPQTMATVLTLT